MFSNKEAQIKKGSEENDVNFFQCPEIDSFNHILIQNELYSLCTLGLRLRLRFSRYGLNGGGVKSL
jgi:hypothetical protein